VGEIRLCHGYAGLQHRQELVAGQEALAGGQRDVGEALQGREEVTLLRQQRLFHEEWGRVGQQR
jgi:hypothetical protein